MPERLGLPVPAVRRRLRPGLELARAYFLPCNGRPGDRRFFRCGTYVHCGDLTSGEARPPGWDVPDQCGHGNSAGLSFKLSRDLGRIRRFRVALEIRNARATGD